MRKILVPWVAALAVVCGCGKQDESVARKAGSKVGETLTAFASGVGKGIDKQMVVTAELSEELTKQGITKTISKAIGMDHQNQKGISVYFIAKAELKAKFIAKAVNKEGMEIGRSVVDVEFAIDDAKYVTFQFDGDMDTQLVDKYLIDLKK